MRVAMKKLLKVIFWMFCFSSFSACANETKTVKVPLPEQRGLFDTTSNRAKLAEINLTLPISDKSSSGYLIPNTANQAITLLGAGLPSDFLTATTKGYRFAPQLWSLYRITVLDGLEEFLDNAWQLDPEKSPVCKEIWNAGLDKTAGCSNVLLMCLRDYRISGHCDLSTVAQTQHRLRAELELPSIPPAGCNANQAKPYDAIDGLIFGKYTNAYATTTCGGTPWVYLLGKGWLKPSDIKQCTIVTRGLSDKLKNGLSVACKYEPEGLDDFYHID